MPEAVVRGFRHFSLIWNQLSMKPYKIIASLIGLVASTAPVYSNGIYFASPEGAGNGSGDSWTNAFAAKNIADILENREKGDVVYLLEGTYTGTTVRPIEGIDIIGGFPSTAKGSDLSGYNPWTYHTIFTSEGKNDTDALIKIEGDPDKTEDLWTIFKGIRFSGCTGSTESSSYSGTAFNCTHANVVMEDCTFENNTSYQGACVVPAQGSRFHALHCVWNGNRNINTTTGGNMMQSVINGRGAAGSDTHVVLEGCVMVNNYIEDPEARETANYGGSISMQDGHTNLCMVNCYADGGDNNAIHQNGGLMRLSNNSTLHFFAFNTFTNYETLASECKGKIISFNGLTPFYMQGNLMITKEGASVNDDNKANNAVFIQGWNSNDMSEITSGGYNSVSGTMFSTYNDNNCTMREQQPSDNWLAAGYTDVFKSNAPIANDGRFYLEPKENYRDVNLSEAIGIYNSFKMPDCFKWANIDLSKDLFGNLRATTTYRGAYDPNAITVDTNSGIITAFSEESIINITARGNGVFSVENSEGAADVFDIAGRRVISVEVCNASDIDLSSYPSGIYFIKIDNKSFKVCK